MRLVKMESIHWGFSLVTVSLGIGILAGPRAWSSESSMSVTSTVTTTTQTTTVESSHNDQNGKNVQIQVKSSENEILDGSAEIEGDSSPLLRQAKENWKKACNDWKAEVKDLNKDNQVLMMNCSTPRCAPEANASTVCRSNATYKIRMKVH